MSADSRTLCVLIIEDHPPEARLMREMLAEATGEGSFEVECADRLSTGLDRLERGGIDAVLLDLSLPDSWGVATVEKALLAAPTIPILVLSGLDDEQIALQAVHRGAQDYLVKSHVDSHWLPRAIRYAIERRQLLAELEHRRQQQLQAKDVLLSHVSHELRTPLAAIYWFVSNLLDGLVGALTAEQRDHLEVIMRNSIQLKGMITDLMDATGAVAGKLLVRPIRTSITGAVREALESCRAAAAEKSIRLSADADAVSPHVWADPERTRQVLINLVSNAVKFTPEHGAVTVRGHVWDPKSEFLCLSVADTGPGIHPEHHQVIFERLFQEPGAIEASRKGLGLGLFIAKELVTRQGGRIWVESERGHGSTFSFTLPIFSLTRVCTPIFTARNLEVGSLALITVDVAPRKTDLSPTIERCILPDRAMLIPSRSRGKDIESYFVVSCATRSEAQRIARDIQEQLEQYEEMHNCHLHPNISIYVVEATERQTGEPFDRIAQELTRRADLVANVASDRSLSYDR
jgi:signal transduction histidine kinase